MKITTVCVLGMHRSGTSCLAGTLEEVGVFFGRVNRHSPDNTKGNREHPRIMALHTDLLLANWGKWHKPPEQVRWTEAHEGIRDQIIREFEGKSPWGFKDPRTLLTLDGWLDALPRLTLVGIFRHPLAVAHSLQHRNQFPLDKGLHLWTLYNQKLMDYFTRFQFPILSFDGPAETLRRRLSDLTEALSLPRPADAPTFFDPDLRHAEVEEDTPLAPPVRSLYEQLNRVALSFPGRRSSFPT
jgi:hypothetical protein